MNEPTRTPITTPAPDFDRLAYWAGMAMRALPQPPYKVTLEERPNA